MSKRVSRGHFAPSLVVAVLSALRRSQSELLPEPELDDLAYSENIGAYSNVSATWFNGFRARQGGAHQPVTLCHLVAANLTAPGRYPGNETDPHPPHQ